MSYHKTKRQCINWNHLNSHQNVILTTTLLTYFGDLHALTKQIVATTPIITSAIIVHKTAMPVVDSIHFSSAELDGADVVELAVNDVILDMLNWSHRLPV